MTKKAPKPEKPECKFDQKSLAALRPLGISVSYSDPGTPGLWFRMTAAGSKTWLFYYRMGGRGTKLQCLTVGKFAAMPLDHAQRKARAYRTQVDDGIDPAKVIREATHRGETVAKLATRFLEEYAPGHLAENSIDGYTGCITKHIVPGLGKHPARDLTRDQVAAWHRGKSAEPVGANRALAVLSAIYSKMHPDLPNPCKGVERFPEEPRVRDVLPRELAAVGKAIHQLHSEGCNPWALAAIQVAALCAGRISEVLALKRGKDTHLDQGYALVRDHKTARRTGAKHLELPPAAVQILKTVPRLDGNPWYFPGRSKGQHLTRDGLHKVWMVVRDLAGVPDLHLHDFRSFAASEGLDQDIDPKLTSRVLGHGDQRTTEKHYTKVRNKKAAKVAAKISAPVAVAFGLEDRPGPSIRKLLRRGFARVKTRGEDPT